MAEKLTPEAAALFLRGGGRVRVVVDPGASEPTVLVAWIENGKVMSEAVAGWAQGVVEPVCFEESGYLMEHFFAGGRELLAEPAPPAEACIFHPDRPALPSGPALCASCDEATADARSGGW